MRHPSCSSSAVDPPSPRTRRARSPSRSSPTFPERFRAGRVALLDDGRRRRATLDARAARPHGPRLLPAPSRASRRRRGRARFRAASSCVAASRRAFRLRRASTTRHEVRRASPCEDRGPGRLASATGPRSLEKTPAGADASIRRRSTGREGPRARRAAPIVVRRGPRGRAADRARSARAASFELRWTSGNRLAMHIEILTIFPGYFDRPLRESLLGKAIAAGLLEVDGDRPARLRRRTGTARSTTSPTAAAPGWS